MPGLQERICLLNACGYADGAIAAQTGLSAARIRLLRRALGLPRAGLPAGQGLADHTAGRPQELMSEAEITKAYEKAGRGY